MRSVLVVVFLASVFGAARPAQACGSVMFRARGNAMVVIDGPAPEEVLGDQLVDAHVRFNKGDLNGALRLVQRVLRSPDFSLLTHKARTDAHLLAAHTAFALEKPAMVEQHYAAAVKLSPKLQKDWDAARFLMSTWKTPAVVAVAKPEAKEPTMDALHWAALAEAQAITHEEAKAQVTVEKGLKEHPGNQALLDLQARLPPPPEPVNGEVIEDSFSNF